MLVATLVGMDAATAQTELRASVDLSEWTPSQNLVLSLATGDYVIAPPADGRPETIAQAAERKGQLAGESLQKARALAEQAFKTGLTKRHCEAEKGRDGDLLVSNAVGPMELTLTDGRVTQTSTQTQCRTQAANVLFRYITRVFDGQTP